MNMRINSYGEHINDTNLNFYQLFFNYSGETMYQGIDFMTEWYNTYSKHFLDKVDGSYIVYEYDEQGNLVQFTACNKVTHKPFRKVTIQYLR